MFAFLRNRIVWIVAAVIVVAGGGGLYFNSQAEAKKAAAAKAEAAAADQKSPYAAVANGKADVEGGIIQVAARRAGVIREVLAQEGDMVTRGQVLARLEDDEPRLAAQRAAAEVAQARAALALLEVQLSSAQREERRLQGLASTNFVAGQKLDQARDQVREAHAKIAAQQAIIATADARLAESRYDQELSIIRAPADGRIVRRYANPGAGASTLNVSNMFDLEPQSGRIVRAEIAEGALPYVNVGQTVSMSPEADPTKIYPGRVLRRAAVFGARKLQSDDPNERTDDRVVEVVVAADGAPFLIGQRVLVKFMDQKQASVPAQPAG
ncbi:efflux RND transporter periplasmic adaptor subunit [Phenylobacterium sp. J367]|uniref:efflux RND transporter periplasmic adaptor subunit n=1 Tax=Phenylobacterium sp. J367 TaxID=2898435 RepID=UPI002151155D|nr:HlyD family efflux transporter periplasmic adaptor subunit [Phenylobacterium sp. J367]MCR5879027.1 efflux RND transporter periplasmic adaptor subunit [Phenylobacterium sp. J367]